MRNKIGTMFLASAVALAFIGGSYAMWSETIIMQGSVTTGTLDIDWSLGTFGDDEPVDKDVSSINAYIDADGILHVVLTNVYPCVTYYVNFDVHCVGNVPVHFDVTCDPAWLFTSGIITIDNIEGVQLHQNDIWYGTLEFHLTNELWDDYCEYYGWVQGNTIPYEFTVEIMGYQWNEQLP